VSSRPDKDEVDWLQLEGKDIELWKGIRLHAFVGVCRLLEEPLRKETDCHFITRSQEGIFPGLSLCNDIEPLFSLTRLESLSLSIMSQIA
jgi:hypothetical protein